MDIPKVKSVILERLEQLDKMLYQMDAGVIVHFNMQDIEKLRRVNRQYLLALELMEKTGRPLQFVKLRHEEVALN